MPERTVIGGRYEVMRTVSEGRRATVLQALDLVHDRLVALKVYPVRDDDRDALLAEARVLMSIRPHPGLPVVRGDLFTDAGDQYVVVMNWVDGTDLQQVLDEEGDPGLPLQEVIDDLAQVADALDHLHAHDPPIVHGDVKPANLVRTTDGHVVLVDFDLAGAGADASRVGTLGYVAPEVATGEKPSPAADVFGLGATIVTLLNGQPPHEAAPTFPSVDPAERSHLARVLRSALATEPARRPRSAGRLIANLRSAARGELPSGVIALLAAEVCESARLWREDPDEMRAAMTRLRDHRDTVVERHHGRVVSSMNEGDRTIAVFREASGAALAARDLHDELTVDQFPPGFDVRLRIAVAVGEAMLTDGAYTGAVVDHVLALRTLAEPGATLVPEATAELLVGLVGREISIVPLGQPASSALARGGSVFGVTRPGREHTARLAGPAVSELPPPIATDPPPPAPAAERVPTRASVIADALQRLSTLVPLVVGGLALIYAFVLAPELGMATPALLIAAVAFAVAIGAFVRSYRAGERARAEIVERVARARAEALERAQLHEHVTAGFAALATDESRNGLRIVSALRAEYDAMSRLVEREAARVPSNLATLLPDLTADAYGHGMSALSDALELLQLAEGPEHRRLLGELHDVERRLAGDAYDDDRARARDEQRRDTRRQLVLRHAEGRARAGDLMFEAEQCTTALAEARVELASSGAGDQHADVDTVVRNLQTTIRNVRELQEELRQLGYA
jgi:serine/threonine protein kinase